ncbi:metallophosphoesterase [Desulfatiferula olefinivorans]
MFLIFFTGVLILGLVYIHARFTLHLCEKPAHRYLVLGLLVSVVASVVGTLTLKVRGLAGPLVDGLAWFGYLGIGLCSFLLTLLVITDLMMLSLVLIRRIGGREARPRRPDPDRRVFLKKSAAWTLAGGTLVLGGAGLFGAKRQPAVREVRLPIAGLHPDLDGFSIVQISDIHLSSTIGRPFLEDVVRRVNALSPSLTAVTGDLADGRVIHLGEAAAPLQDLVSTHGTFFVTGNHEYYFNAREWIDHLETMGITVLTNEHRLIQSGEGRLLVAGVPDLFADRFIPDHVCDPARAMKGAPDAHVKILLAHQPMGVFEAARAGFDIQISGHTHGGQFFPWTVVVGLNQTFMAGLYRHGPTLLYVSRGTGYWGPPMRLGAPSEITRLILTAA